MKILALDFDGVIADSMHECLFVGFNAYLKLNKDTKLFDGKKFTFSNFKEKFSKDKAIVDKYKVLRPFVIDAFCYHVLLHMIENNIHVKNQQEYNALREKFMNLYDEYSKHFYSERYSLQENYDEYFQLLSPYRFVSFLKSSKEKFSINISTNNSRKSVEPFLNKCRIKVNILADKSLGTDKIKQIEFLKEKLKCKYSDIYFIDDQIRNLVKSSKLGVQCFLAGWGYNNEEQRTKARELKIDILDEDEFEQKLTTYKG